MKIAGEGTIVVQQSTTNLQAADSSLQSPKQKGRRGRQILIVAGILLAIGLLVGLNMYRLSQRDEVPVKVDKVEEGRIEARVFTSGKVIVRDQEEVYATTSGIVQTVLVKLGDLVEAGQPLVQMKDEEFALAVRQAEANLTAAQANLARAKEATGPAEIVQAENALTQAEANLENARQRLERNQILYEQGIVSIQELEALQLEVEIKQAQYEAASKQLDTARNGVQSSLRALEAQVAQSETALALSRNQLNQATIVTGQSGQVLQLDVEKGQFVSPGKLVAVVGDIKQLEVQAELSEADAAQVKVGQTVEITADALSKAKFFGEVKEISPRAIARSSGQGEQTLVPIVVAVIGDTALRPGYNVDLDIITGTAENALLVPYDALIEQEDHTEVLVVQEGVIQHRTVTTGLSDEQRVQVLTGLQPGETVVLNPDDDLADGTAVKATPSGID
ncbi:MAG: efflux RND transporter periplasmic adaptor subunit [Bacillota bacterium]|jgi:HlyD family secretion protein